MSRLRLRTVLLDAKKAIAVLGVMAASALGYGLIDSPTAGYVTGGLGVLSAGVAYLLRNEPRPLPERGVQQRPGRA